jgi:molybdopterin-guanine dinucleotide biosynthesis protein A
MGRDKAFIAVEGRPMVTAVATALYEAGCAPVVAVGGDAGRLTELGLQVVPDEWPGEGPLGAIITALRHTSGSATTVVVACDLPWLTADVVNAIIDVAHRPDVDVAIATTQLDAGAPVRDEPMCACWSRSAESSLVIRFDAGERAVHAVLDGLRVRRVPVPALPLRNVNVPGDLPSV